MAADNPELSAVIPIRNRAGVRLENCLRSLRWQELAPERIEIVLSDFGSSPEQAESVDRLAETYGARVVRTRTRSMWNRSLALNLGIRASRGEVVLCTDADMIFAPSFAPVILDEHGASQQELLVICRCLDLPESVETRVWDREDFDDLRARAALRHAKGTGACQAARRSFFFAVHGYDQKYRRWGKEDMDMLRRARLSGLQPRWIHERTAMLHQWHPDAPGRKGLLWRWNRVRFWWTRNQIVKNDESWGTV